MRKHVTEFLNGHRRLAALHPDRYNVLIREVDTMG